MPLRAALSIPPPENVAALPSIRLCETSRSPPEFAIPPPTPFSANPPVTATLNRNSSPSLRMLPPLPLFANPSSIVIRVRITSVVSAGIRNTRPAKPPSMIVVRAEAPMIATPLGSTSSPPVSV